MHPMNIDEGVLYGAIGALFSALVALARYVHMEVKKERDQLREDVLATLASMAERESRTRDERDALVREIIVKIDGVRRMLNRKSPPPNGGAK